MYSQVEGLHVAKPLLFSEDVFRIDVKGRTRMIGSAKCNGHNAAGFDRTWSLRARTHRMKNVIWVMNEGQWTFSS